MPRPPRELHERVAAHVQRSGLSEEQIAKRTRWSSKRVRRLLVGDTRLLGEDLETLARVIGISPGELFEEPSNAVRVQAAAS